MKRESTVVELNETPRSSGRQKERKSRDRVFIRAATVEKRGEWLSVAQLGQLLLRDELRREKETAVRVAFQIESPKVEARRGSFL